MAIFEFLDHFRVKCSSLRELPAPSQRECQDLDATRRPFVSGEAAERTFTADERQARDMMLLSSTAFWF